MSVNSYQSLVDGAIRNDSQPQSVAARRAAFAKLQAIGLPTRKQDDWKYTNIKPLTDTIYRLAEPATTHKSALPDISQYVRGQEWNLVFLNGHFYPDLSQNKVVHGVTIRHDQVPPTELADQPFDLLNRALLGANLSVNVQSGVKVESVLYIDHFFSRLNHPTVAATRTTLRLQKGSSCTVVERFLPLESSAVFSSHVLDVHLEVEAELNLLKDGGESDEFCHVGHTQIALADRATAQVFVLQQGGRLVKQDLTICIDGQEAKADAFGLYLLQNRQHCDQKVCIDHRQPSSKSRQLYKGILDDQSRGVFNGKIFIRPQAQQTDARQLNKNLMLSSEAEVDTKPELNIEADDVGCSHGATVGQLNEDELFYMRSRGLTLPEASSLLCRAFADDILLHMHQPAFQTLARRRLERYFSKKRGT